mgnify:CR=1 FL=1
MQAKNLKIFENKSVSPDFCATFIIPEKKQIEPHVFKQKFIASDPPDKSDDNMSSILPEKKAKTVENTIIIAPI